MATKATRKSLLFGIIAAIVAGCAGQTTTTAPSPETQLKHTRDKLRADIRQCSKQHGYDPKAVGLAEKALAPQELQWRQCSYDAVRAYARGIPALTGVYEQLIAEDIEMTKRIQQGEMTRSQRRARIEQQIANIRGEEEKQIKAAAVEQERHLQLLLEELSRSM